MATKEKINQIKITLPLVALCLPLFANHQVIAENGCPFETYLRLEEKCVDISKSGFSNITQEIDDHEIKEINLEIKQVSQKLAEFNSELAKVHQKDSNSHFE